MHGLINNAVQSTDQTVPRFTSSSAPAELSHAPPLCQTSGGVEESSHRSNVPSQDSENSAPLYANMPPGRVYCQEYDCGRGFSSEAHLESHTRFFHPRKPARTTTTALSNDTPDVDEKSAEHSLAYFSPTSAVSYSRPGGSAIQDSSDPVGTYVPVRQGWYQGAELKAGEGVRQMRGGPLEAPTTSQTDAHETPAVTTSTPLSMQCRICDAPPTVGTRPTVTMCGHLFCSECITRHVMSTSRCPVCDNALLLYCLFKLDPQVSS